MYRSIHLFLLLNKCVPNSYSVFAVKLTTALAIFALKLAFNHNFIATSLYRFYYMLAALAINVLSVFAVNSYIKV